MNKGKKDKINILQSIGFITLGVFLYDFFKRINEETSTKLYDKKALEILDDDKKYNEVYGKFKPGASVS